MKLSILSASLFIGLIASPLVFAQDVDQDMDQWVDFSSYDLDEMLRKIEAEDDGDDDLPTKTPRPKVHPRVLSAYGFKQTLRFKLNKDAFIDGYLDQGVGGQNDPYDRSTSKFAGGFNANLIWQGFTLSGGVDVKRNYAGTFSEWDGLMDRTYTYAVARKVKLSEKWNLTPTVRQTFIDSDQITRNLRRTDIALPFNYALNKVWTIKALTIGYSTQTFTNRTDPQTDITWTFSTGVAYKASEKTTFDVTLSQEQRYSDRSSVEYLKTTIMPKFEYKMSPTSTAGFGVGYVTHTNNTEQFSRWLLVPKIQLRWDI
jgi:hypothetical protein